MSTGGNPTLVSQTEVSTASGGGGGGGGGPTPQDDLAVRESATAGLPAVKRHSEHDAFSFG
jgi:hypothetical protein